MSGNYDQGLDQLSKAIQSSIQKGIESANKNHQPPYDFATFVKKEVSLRMEQLRVSIPAILYNTGLSKTFSSNTTFEFACEVKSGSHVTTKSNPLLAFPFVSKERKKYTVLYKYVIKNIDIKLDDSANNLLRQQYLNTTHNNELNFSATRDLSPITTYNSALRLNYIRGANKLFPLYDDVWRLNPSNVTGIDARFKLKETARRMSIAGGGRMLDLIEPMERKPIMNPNTGKVTRFWYTRPAINWVSGGGAALGVIGLGLTVRRVVIAEDKPREVAKITGGLATAWILMSAGAPAAATAGAAVSPFITPIGGIIVGGVIEFGLGAVGAIGGEWVTEEVLQFLEDK